MSSSAGAAGAANDARAGGDAVLVTDEQAQKDEAKRLSAIAHLRGQEALLTERLPAAQAKAKDVAAEAKARVARIKARIAAVKAEIADLEKQGA